MCSLGASAKVQKVGKGLPRQRWPLPRQSYDYTGCGLTYTRAYKASTTLPPFETFADGGHSARRRLVERCCAIGLHSVSTCIVAGCWRFVIGSVGNRLGLRLGFIVAGQGRCMDDDGSGFFTGVDAESSGRLGLIDDQAPDC